MESIWKPGLGIEKFVLDIYLVLYYQRTLGVKLVMPSWGILWIQQNAKRSLIEDRIASFLNNWPHCQFATEVFFSRTYSGSYWASQRRRGAANLRSPVNWAPCGRFRPHCPALFHVELMYSVPLSHQVISSCSQLWWNKRGHPTNCSDKSRFHKKTNFHMEY